MTPTTPSTSRGCSRKPSWVEPLLAVPYLWRGRSRFGADCYGLVRLAYRMRLGIELPRLDDQPERVAIADYMRAELARHWAPVALRDAQELDVVTLDGDAGVGVVLEDHQALTTLAASGPVTFSLRSAAWAKRITGCYRLSTRCG